MKGHGDQHEYLYVLPRKVVRFFVYKSDTDAPLNALVQLETPSQTGVLVVVNDSGWEILSVLGELANFEPHQNIVFGHDVGRGAEIEREKKTEFSLVENPVSRE